MALLKRIFMPSSFQLRNIYGRSRVGNRDWVGHGQNGCANYKDNVLFPFPAMRFMENNDQICCLRQKEMGDWTMLSCEEKKSLYRASFCQTFSEFQSFTGQWKGILGAVLFFTSIGWLGQIYFHFCVYEGLPVSFAPVCQQAQLRRMLDLHMDPIDGLSSRWDYENDCWKSSSWFGGIF